MESQQFTDKTLLGTPSDYRESLGTVALEAHGTYMAMTGEQSGGIANNQRPTLEQLVATAETVANLGPEELLIFEGLVKGAGKKLPQRKLVDGRFMTGQPTFAREAHFIVALKTLRQKMEEALGYDPVGSDVDKVSLYWLRACDIQVDEVKTEPVLAPVPTPVTKSKEPTHQGPQTRRATIVPIKLHPGQHVTVEMLSLPTLQESLNTEEQYILHKFLAKVGYRLARRDIVDKGFYPQAPSAAARNQVFNKRIQSLADKLRITFGYDVMGQIGERRLRAYWINVQDVEVTPAEQRPHLSRPVTRKSKVQNLPVPRPPSIGYGKPMEIPPVKEAYGLLACELAQDLRTRLLSRGPVSLEDATADFFDGERIDETDKKAIVENAIVRVRLSAIAEGRTVRRKRYSGLGRCLVVVVDHKGNDPYANLPSKRQRTKSKNS